MELSHIRLLYENFVTIFKKEQLIKPSIEEKILRILENFKCFFVMSVVFLSTYQLNRLLKRYNNVNQLNFYFWRVHFYTIYYFNIYFHNYLFKKKNKTTHLFSHRSKYLSFIFLTFCVVSQDSIRLFMQPP